MKTNNIATFFAAKYRIVFWVLVLMLAWFSITPRGYAAGTDESTVTYPYKKVFVISSYYSPLPDQTKYYTGSYESDIRLNGGGVHGADGTPVYVGMAAAGRMYPYGTKFDVPGIGIVTVHDRGGAIHDNRIDLWMGYGEEGLARALAWGKRTVEVTVHGQKEELKDSINLAGLPKASLAFLSEPSSKGTGVTVAVAEPEVKFGDTGEHVRLVQHYLNRLGYFDSELNGAFDEKMKKTLINFQIDNTIIVNESDASAGVFGPRTQNALIGAIVGKQEEQFDMLSPKTLLKGAAGDEVSNFQTLLHSYGYLDKVTKQFDTPTVDALTRLQIDLGVVTKASDHGAGIYGPKTQAAIKSLITTTWAVPTKSDLTSARPITTQVSNTLSFAQSTPDVYKLQEFLFKTHFLRVTPTGFYGKTTEHAVMKFQQAFNIIVDERSTGAGVAGPRTLEKVNEVIAAGTEQTRIIAEKTETQRLVAARIMEEKKLLSDLGTPPQFTGEIAYGYTGEQVEKLQTVLQKLGFYNGKLTTDYFGDVTKNSLISFQKSHGLVGSGEMDEQTRLILNKLVTI